MKNKKGSAKPLVLTIGAAVLAGLGYLTYINIAPQNNVSITNVNTSNLNLGKVDMNTTDSIAAALYTAVLTENFSDVPAFVDKLRELEFIKENGGNTSLQMNAEQQRKPVDIKKYLSNSALEVLEERIAYMTSRLTANQYIDTYKFYLESLIHVFSFYQPTPKTIATLGHSIEAYNEFLTHENYTLSDIRSLYGSTDTLRLCRYIIGTNNFTRIAAHELSFYMNEEIQRFIKQIPINITSENSYYVNSDFANITPASIDELNAMNHIFPSLITYLTKIENVKKDDIARDIQVIEKQFKNRITKAINFTDAAKVFYECQATTSEPFSNKAVSQEGMFQKVNTIDNINLNTTLVNFESSIQGCANISNAYVLFPDLKDFKQLVKNADKLSEEDKKLVDNDLKIIEALTLGKISKNTLNLIGTDISAIEQNVVTIPEPGRFIGKNNSGILYNLNLKSLNVLRKNNNIQNLIQNFTDSTKLTAKRDLAIYKLNVIADISVLENHLNKIDFKSLISNPNEYLAQRDQELAKINLEFQNSKYAKTNFNEYENVIASNYGSDDRYSEDYNITSENVITEDSTVIVSEEVTVAEEESVVVAENTTISSDTTTEIVVAEEKTPETVVVEEKPTIEVAKETPKVEEKVVEIAKVEEKTVEIAKVEETPVEETKTVEFMSLKELSKTSLDNVKKQVSANNPDAMFEYGYRLVKGVKGTKRNQANGVEMLKKAVGLEQPQAAYMLANIYKNSKDRNSKKEEIKKLTKFAADKGISEAMVDVGLEYLAENKHDKAAEIFIKVSQLDNNRAQYQLALLMLEGKHIKANPEKAFNLLSAAKKYPPAAYELAKVYESELLPAIKDQRLANDNYIYAARKGYQKAYKKAGLALLDSKATTNEAIKLLTSLPESELDADVNHKLLDYYIKTKNNKEVAKILMNASDELKNAHPVEVADMYFYGSGVPKDYKKAEELYREAAKNNIANAYCRIGDMYYMGLGKSVDLRAAIANYTKGADRGSSYCSKQAAIIKVTEPKYRQLSEAFSLFSSLSDEELDNKSITILSLMYIYGQGTNKDVNIGLKLLNKVNSKPASYIKTIITSDMNNMKKNACTEENFAGNIGIKSSNNDYLAAASLGNLFFFKQLKDNNTQFINYENIINASKKVCGENFVPTVLHDAKPKFAKPTNEKSNKEEDIYRIGMHYFAEKNYVKAFEFIDLAAQMKHAKAANNLGIFYLFGIGTKINYKEAYSMLSTASAFGDNLGGFNLAAMRKHGFGGKPDHNKAADLLSVLSFKKHNKTNKYLGFSYTFGINNTQNDQNAFDSMIKLVIDNNN